MGYCGKMEKTVLVHAAYTCIVFFCFSHKFLLFGIIRWGIVEIDCGCDNFGNLDHKD